MTLLPSECPNCGRLHHGYDFNETPGPVQSERDEWKQLALDMGEALRMVRNELWEQQERDAPPHGYKRKEALIESADSVLARLDGIANNDI